MSQNRWTRSLATVFSVALFMALAATSAAQTLPSVGAWAIRSSRDAGNTVNFEVLISEPGGGHSSWGNDIDLSRLRGLSRSALFSSGSNVEFDVVRDAGTLHCAGHAALGSGGGTFTYAPNPSFAAELARRGVSRPNGDEQLRMTLSDVPLSFVDTLRSYHYSVTSPEELIRMTDHGVDSKYVTSIETAGYHVESAEDLVRMVDHGVTQSFIESMRGIGYRPSADELVRMVDHGVTAEFAQGMIAMGYHPSVDQLVRLVDHGVTIDFVKHLKSRGYSANVEQLIRLRDAGI